MNHQNGIIGVATGEIGRYRLFDICLARVKKPEGSEIIWQMGVDIPGNYNKIFQSVLDGDYEWAWILGDDHVFPEDLLMKLLDRNVDIVVPLCSKRQKPFEPVLNESNNNSGIINGMKKRDWDFLKNKTGILELNDSNTGNAGMLVRRNVIESMHYPWFENGKFSGGTGCDLWFCEKAKQWRFKLYLDLDNIIGHIIPSVVWPKNNNGEWSAEVRS
jgi:hypothetical protein